MKLSELDKSSKYGYRRKDWDIHMRNHTFFDFTEKEWTYASSFGVERLNGFNLRADNWHLSDILVTHRRRPILELKGIR